MQELNGSAGNLNEAAQTTGNSANDVLLASQELNQQTETLKTKVNEFLSNVKAA